MKMAAFPNAFIPQTLSNHVRTCSTSLAATRQATFGMGCFWKPSEQLLQVPGVMDTIVGYTGNPQAGNAAPSYESVCMGRNWVEGVRVVYDDETVSYSQLLDAFFEAQEPKYGYRQYASIIFAHDEEQSAIANDWLMEARVRSDGVPKTMTTIEQAAPFFRAEQYHQRYWQKTKPRMAALVLLLTLSSGIADAITPVAMQSSVHVAANALALAGSFFVMAERFIDRKVVKLE
ncbi:peptide-methionine (S)-S-oxide reductase [Mayamaea pseudoterrestris]|nr:peptide-methionine (S)-S-oxide reductase [Mayamaea pseudoterrestris]